MRSSLTLPLVALVAIVSGCGMVGHSSATEIKDANADSRYNWPATLVTPSELAGAMQVLTQRIGESAEPYAYVRRDREAAAHLYRVAAGLDSMIPGVSGLPGFRSKGSTRTASIKAKFKKRK